MEKAFEPFACKCGEQEFIVVEYLIHRALSSEEVKNKILVYKTPENGIESIRCRRCAEEFPVDKLDVEFCN